MQQDKYIIYPCVYHEEKIHTNRNRHFELLFEKASNTDLTILMEMKNYAKFNGNLPDASKNKLQKMW
jgi:ferredoxin-thioredoxin reductase catalytic subunit